MQTIVERGCGLDVHQATVVACLLIARKDGRVQKQMRTFGTNTRDLVNLREWLLSEGCTHLAMESTGVYWKPVYAILEGALEIVVANAQHVPPYRGLRCFHQKETQQRAALFADMTRPSAVATGVFFRNQTHITRDLLATSKPLNLSDDQHERQRRQSTHSGMGHQALGHGIFFPDCNSSACEN